MKDMKKINIFFNFVLLLTFLLKNNQKTYFADMSQLSQTEKIIWDRPLNKYYKCK